jgi:hypothetical protein
MRTCYPSGIGGEKEIKEAAGLFRNTKNQYLSHSEPNSYQLNSVKSCSSTSFQQRQRHIPIPPKFPAMI